MGFAEKIEGGNYTHKDVADMFAWFTLAKANEKMLIMERENAEKREYEVIRRANELETRLDRLTILIEAALDSRNAEDKAGVIYECAKENQADCCFAASSYEQAMVAASNAENELRNAITTNSLQQSAQGNALHDIPPAGSSMRKLGQRLAELLEEDQFDECEQLLFGIMDETTYNPFRPIETAPNDGSWIVIARFGKNESGTELGLWWICKACWSNRWSRWWDGIEPSGLNKPTHWTPLPNTPNV